MAGDLNSRKVSCKWIVVSLLFLLAINIKYFYLTPSSTSQITILLDESRIEELTGWLTMNNGEIVRVDKPFLKSIYLKPPIISYKRSKSLKDTLVRSKRLSSEATAKTTLGVRAGLSLTYSLVARNVKAKWRLLRVSTRRYRFKVLSFAHKSTKELLATILVN